MRGLMVFAGFAATVPMANWMIGHVGDCIPHGPCLIPVGFGLSAPSGVLIVGVALALRDEVHIRLGWQAAVAAIVTGAFLSWLIAPPALVLASVAAFVVGEMMDLAVFARMRRWSLPAAILTSGIVGAAADSSAFLWLAFGSMDFIAGQVIGKAYGTIAFALLAWRKVAP